MIYLRRRAITHPELVPTNDDIFADIEHVFAQGLRRPAYPADLWSEQFCLQRFRDLGLENARLEPFEVNYWEPRDWSLHAWADGQDEAEAINVPCFPLPYTVPADGVTGCLVPFDATQPSTVAGNVALFNGRISHLPYHHFIPPAIACYDPDGTVDGYTQVLPFSTGRQETIDAIQASGASAFIASLSGYPGDSHEQFVPYRGAILPVPGVWVSGRDGARLAEMLSEGSANVRLTVDTDMHVAESHNVLAELPGADEELVVIGSHHDAPWASAVEDTSGLALVLAQAEYWSRVPREERPHSDAVPAAGGAHGGRRWPEGLRGAPRRRSGTNRAGGAPGARRAGVRRKGRRSRADGAPGAALVVHEPYRASGVDGVCCGRGRAAVALDRRSAQRLRGRGTSDRRARLLPRRRAGCQHAD